MNAKPIELAQRLCTCAMHCSNKCEVACCGHNAPWCDCWCHAEEYKRAAAPHGGSE